MSASDKISWIGGMMGLFTGFSFISGLEIMYWLWFKVVLHGNEIEPEPEEDPKDEKISTLEDEMSSQRISTEGLKAEFETLKTVSESMQEELLTIKMLREEIEELKMRTCDCTAGVPKPGVMFDAIFHEPQQKESGEPAATLEVVTSQPEEEAITAEPPPAVLTIEAETTRTPTPSLNKDVKPVMEPAEDPQEIPTNNESNSESKENETDAQPAVEDKNDGVDDNPETVEPLEAPTKAPPKKKKAAKGKGKGKKKKPKVDGKNKEE